MLKSAGPIGKTLALKNCAYSLKTPFRTNWQLLLCFSAMDK